MFQRWFNYFFISHGLNYSGLVASEVGKGMYRVRQKLDFLRLPNFIDERMERSFQHKVEERTTGVFVKGNQLLQEMSGYDLGALGYEV
ncbi:MAG: hypothetical protein U5K56_11455 [Halioglobus sp.]|nr:hypothetical protein [Halioglobus sp.]